MEPQEALLRGKSLAPLHSLQVLVGSLFRWLGSWVDQGCFRCLL